MTPPNCSLWDLVRKREEDSESEDGEKSCCDTDHHRIEECSLFPPGELSDEGRAGCGSDRTEEKKGDPEKEPSLGIRCVVESHIVPHTAE